MTTQLVISIPANTWRKMNVKATLYTYWEKRINIKWKKYTNAYFVDSPPDVKNDVSLLSNIRHHGMFYSILMAKIWCIFGNQDAIVVVLWCVGFEPLSVSHLELGLLKNSRLPFFDTIYWTCQNLQVWIILFIIFLFPSDNKDGKKFTFKTKNKIVISPDNEPAPLTQDVVWTSI